MPLTLAHPAAVVPLRALLGPRAVFSGLVIGSMAPDLFLLVPGGWLSRDQTHTLGALLWFCVPAGLAMYLLFRHYLSPMIGYVLTGRFSSGGYFLDDGMASGVTRATLPALIGSIILGAVTHLVWDSFTNAKGALITGFDIRWLLLIHVDGTWFYVHNFLHLVSSVIGFGFVLYWFGRQIRQNKSTAPHATAKLRVGPRIAIVVLPLGVAFVIAVVSVDETTLLRRAVQLTGDWVVWTMRAVLLWWLLLGMVYKHGLGARLKRGVR